MHLADAGLGRLDEAVRTRLVRLGQRLDAAGLPELGSSLAGLGLPGCDAAPLLRAGYQRRVRREAFGAGSGGD